LKTPAQARAWARRQLQGEPATPGRGISANKPRRRKKPQ